MPLLQVQQHDHGNWVWISILGTIIRVEESHPRGHNRNPVLRDTRVNLMDQFHYKEECNCRGKFDGHGLSIFDLLPEFIWDKGFNKVKNPML